MDRITELRQERQELWREICENFNGNFSQEEAEKRAKEIIGRMNAVNTEIKALREAKRYENYGIAKI